VGANGATQSIEAVNAGDGQLNLQVSSSVSWLAPSVGQTRDCPSVGGRCVPITIQLRTASLARGTATGVVTVSDPNALDAPQTITVTVAAGGNVPERLEFYLPPNGSSTEAPFNASRVLQTTATTQSGGSWLAVGTQTGSFAFGQAIPYRITATHRTGLPEGVYSGQVVTAGSSIPTENRTIPVTLQVTSQPIPQISPDSLTFRIAAGAARQTQFLSVRNLGLGTLTLSGATAATNSGGNWLSAAPVAGQNLVGVTADASSMSLGTYQGTVTIASNSVGAARTVPVQLEVVAERTPLSYFNGLVNNATFEAGDLIAQGTIVALFGEQFSTGNAGAATSLPLPDQIEGTRVLVNDRPAPIYFVSQGQINFQIPYDTAIGTAVVRVERGVQRGNAVTAEIVRSAARLLRLGLGDYGIAVNQDGTLPIPATAGVPSRPARTGETLVFYALGLGPTNPPVQSGVASPSNPLARADGYRLLIGGTGPFGDPGVEVTPQFAGLTPGFVGLYQINGAIPAQAPRGRSVTVALIGPGGSSNRVAIAIE
jgi:uncharacterized protein (TIGR03437 family)